MGVFSDETSRGKEVRVFELSLCGDVTKRGMNK